MDRRSFLLSSLATTAWGKPRYSPKIAVQVYIWTQNLGARKIPLSEGMPEIFAGCRKAGYHRISLLNSFLTPELLPKTQALVKQYKFHVSDTYIGGRLHEEDAGTKSIEAACRQAEAALSIGSKALTVNADPKHGPKSEAELALQAKMLNRLGEKVKKLGVSLLLHQHSPEMAEKAREWRFVLKNTDPGLVFFNLDLDWVFRGGNKPLELLEEAGERVKSTHVRSSKNGVWSESVGEGDVDYPGIAASMKRRGYTGYLVSELAYEKKTQVTRTLVEDLKLSREFIEKTFGVKA